MSAGGRTVSAGRGSVSRRFCGRRRDLPWRAFAYLIPSSGVSWLWESCRHRRSDRRVLRPRSSSLGHTPPHSLLPHSRWAPLWAFWASKGCWRLVDRVGFGANLFRFVSQPSRIASRLLFCPRQSIWVLSPSWAICRSNSTSASICTLRSMIGWGRRGDWASCLEMGCCFWVKVWFNW